LLGVGTVRVSLLPAPIEPGVRASEKAGEAHFTPTYSSWLNLVERWFSELTTKWLRRGTHRSVAELEAAIQAWIDTWNADPRPFVWTKTADQILDTIATYCQRINNSGH
jgi:DDE superfamily endonuclease